MSGVNSESILKGEGEGHRDLVIEPELAASQVDIKKLQEEIQQLKENLEEANGDNRNLWDGLWKAEEELKDKDTKIREFQETDVAVRRLCALASEVLSTLLGEKGKNRNFEVVNDKVLNKLCDDLEEGLTEWEGNHQLLHDKVEEAMLVVTDLEKLSPYPMGKSNSIPAPPSSLQMNVPKEPPTVQKKKLPSRKPSTSLKAIRRGPSSSVISRQRRRNPVRKCRIQNNPHPSQAVPPAPRVCQPKPPQFNCDHCRSTYTRLTHICSKLEHMKNQQMMPIGEMGGNSMEADDAEEPGSSLETDVEMPAPSSQECDLDPAENEKEGNSGQAQNPDPFVKPRPPLTLMTRTGQDHGFVEARKLSPSEQRKAILEGRSPGQGIRYFCKCGRDFLSYATLLTHIIFIGNGNMGNITTCGLCKHDFDLQLGLQAHLSTEHGVEYDRGKFVCLECGKDLSTNEEELLNHQRAAHGKDNDNDQE